MTSVNASSHCALLSALEKIKEMVSTPPLSSPPAPVFTLRSRYLGSRASIVSLFCAVWNLKVVLHGLLRVRVLPLAELPVEAGGHLAGEVVQVLVGTVETGSHFA